MENELVIRKKGTGYGSDSGDVVLSVPVPEAVLLELITLITTKLNEAQKPQA